MPWTNIWTYSEMQEKYKMDWWRDTQIFAKANRAQCLLYLYNFSTFKYIWIFHNKLLGGRRKKTGKSGHCVVALSRSLAMPIHETVFWETVQQIAQPGPVQAEQLLHHSAHLTKRPCSPAVRPMAPCCS